MYQIKLLNSFKMAQRSNLKYVPKFKLKKIAQILFVFRKLQFFFFFFGAVRFFVLYVPYNIICH